MSLSYCVSSHTGVRRSNNEDSSCARADLGLFVVADGVGGYEAGEVASRAAVEAIEQALEQTAGKTAGAEWPFEYQPALGVDGNRLNWAFHEANKRIRTETTAGRGRHGMATTLAALLCAADGNGAVHGATIGHVGDSRIYRFRRGTLDRLTHDHSWVEEQVRAGVIDQAAARSHPRRNLLTRALSGGADPMVDLAWVPLEKDDVVLLCSDGLCGVLTDDQIAGILRGDDPCEALVHAANLAGGPDNITVILVRL
jgi:serine/threonine protein phosphatase PrpC